MRIVAFVILALSLYAAQRRRGIHVRTQRVDDGKRRGGERECEVDFVIVTVKKLS